MISPSTAPLNEDLTHLVNDLVAEYSGFASANLVTRLVLRSRWRLLAMGVQDDLIVATERVARTQLAARKARHAAF